MRHSAGCQRYDREGVINPGGLLPSICSWRLQPVPRRSHLNGLAARSASPPSCSSHSAKLLLVEAIGKGELSTALTSEACAFRVPHRKGSTEHHSLPALLTHEDDLP
jgi:hypothetical protein